jgi:hypothetical protein
VKHLFLVSIFAALAGLATAAGPYSISIGSGDGSLAFTQIYSDGQILGDDGTFDPVGADVARTTVWRNYFMIHNVTDNTTFWSDNIGTHTPDLPDGTISTNATGFTNSGINLGNNLITGLGVTLGQPTPGQTAQLNFTWAFGNTSASSKTVRVIWFLDVDSYMGASNAYDDDSNVRVNNGLASGFALALGEGTANTNVTGLKGVLVQSNPAATIYGVADAPTGSYGSSYYWTNQFNYAGNGPEVNKNIPPAIANTVQNDGDNNGVSNVLGDVGAALQVEITIPASGTPSINFQALWGSNTTFTGVAGINDWSVY